MLFSVSCEIYSKLAHLAASAVDENWRVVRIEHVKSEKFAIATNRKILAAYFLGATDQPDGAINVIADATLIGACEKEIAYQSNLEIVPVPEISYASAKTTFGYAHPVNAVAFDDKTEIERWRTLAEPVKKSRGAMYWNCESITRLGMASPSGSIRFPEFIDGSKPVVVRDVVDPNWFGLFMPTRLDDNGQPYEVEPATIPEWIKL